MRHGKKTRQKKESRTAPNSWAESRTALNRWAKSRTALELLVKAESETADWGPLVGANLGVVRRCRPIGRRERVWRDR